MNAVLEFEKIVDSIYGVYLDGTDGFLLCKRSLEQIQQLTLEEHPELTLEQFDSRHYHYFRKGPPGPLSDMLHRCTQGEFKKRNSRSGDNFRFIGNMALVALYQYWEDHYRDEIARLFDVENLKEPIMGDIRLLRLSIIHNGGIAIEDVEKCEILKWFKRGDLIFMDRERFREVVFHVKELIKQYKARLSTEQQQAVPTRGERTMQQVVVIERNRTGAPEGKENEGLEQLNQLLKKGEAAHVKEIVVAPGDRSFCLVVVDDVGE